MKGFWEVDFLFEKPEEFSKEEAFVNVPSRNVTCMDADWPKSSNLNFICE